MNVDSRWRSLYVKKLEAEVVSAFQFLRSEGIEPLLIKGWAAARNYPQSVERFYSDVDLAVAAADFDRAKRLLANKPGTKIGIDLHREIRHLDTRPWHEVVCDSLELEISGELIRIPSCEDHLRVLAVHWLNDGGTRKDRLWDIYYAVQNRPESFDWERCLTSVSDVRRSWIITVIGLAHKYLGLAVNDLPFAEEAINLPKWLVATVEKEWKANSPVKPLNSCLNDPKELLKQIRKRIPPNSIQATIEMEGRFDNGSRLKYQVGSMIKRVGPSIRGIRVTLGNRQ
jgi:Uncharacterised nucleotidyltransferase